MKFLLDVNASGVVRETLTAENHDLRLVSQEDIRMSDSNILQWANREERIIVTTDKDFEAMVWREKRTHSGILRLANVPREKRLILLAKVLNDHKKELEKRLLLLPEKVRLELDIKLPPKLLKTGCIIYIIMVATNYPRFWQQGKITDVEQGFANIEGDFHPHSGFEGG